MIVACPPKIADLLEWLAIRCGLTLVGLSAVLILQGLALTIAALILAADLELSLGFWPGSIDRFIGIAGWS
jgi:hypothetical protein